MTQSTPPANKADILRKGLDRVQRELDLAPTDQDEDPEEPRPAAMAIAVPVDQLFLSAIEEAPRVAYQDDRPGDPISSYMACLQSLCNTCGGTWVDDQPGRFAGCYFRTRTEASVYALSAWTCLPGGFLRYVLG
jgi:hypothetical protein